MLKILTFSMSLQNFLAVLSGLPEQWLMKAGFPTDIKSVRLERQSALNFILPAGFPAQCSILWACSHLTLLLQLTKILTPRFSRWQTLGLWAMPLKLFRF